MRVLIACFLIAAGACPTSASAQKASEACKPLYLTFDTGHMGVAPLVADVLKQRGVRATFFAAQEATKEGDGTLGKHWAPWWKARAAEGHEFASHTWDHAYWQADLPPAQPGGLGRGYAVPGLPQGGDRFSLHPPGACGEGGLINPA